MIIQKLKKLFSLIVLIGLALSGADRLSEQWYFTSDVKDPDFFMIPDGCKTFRLGKDYGIDLDTVAGKTGKCFDECIVYNKFTLDRK